MHDKKQIQFDIAFGYENSLGVTRVLVFRFSPFVWKVGRRANILAGGYVIWRRWGLGPFEIRLT